MELLGYWKIVRKRLWLIILLVIIAAGGAYYFNQQQVPEYRTTTTLFLNPGVASPLLPYQASNTVQSLANTYVEFMRTRTFAQLVADSTGLELSQEAILQALATRYVADTQFFRITATHTNPEVAQLLANTSAQVLIAEDTARQLAAQEQIDAQRPVDPDVQALLDLRQSLQEELDLYEGEMNTTREQIRDLELRGPSELNNQRLDALRASLISLQSSRASILTSIADAQAAIVNQKPASERSNVSTAVVVDEAPLPATPLPGGGMQQTIMVLVMALGAGVGLAFLLEYIDYTIKSPEELDAAYGLPALGVIGLARRKAERAKAPQSDLITLNDTFSPLSEAFRSLRTSIGFSSLTRPAQSLLITSAGPGEGKSFVAANLAAALAMGGKRVILVDTDLRKPTLHHVFGVPREPGFTNLLMSQPDAGLAQFLQKTPVKSLRLVTCGTLPPNPADLLGSPRAIEMMQQLSEHADIVIYDSPPAATVTDAAIIAQHVDTVIQVVRAGQTRIDLVQRCKTVLEQVDAQVLGPVLNQVRDSDLGYYAYYYSYGYYGQNGNGQNGSGSGRNGNGRNGNHHGGSGLQQRRKKRGLARFWPRRKPPQRAVPIEPREATSESRPTVGDG
jgi:capsular exopolysaccharide synthesis family protein